MLEGILRYFVLIFENKIFRKYIIQRWVAHKEVLLQPLVPVLPKVRQVGNKFFIFPATSPNCGKPLKV